MGLDTLVIGGSRFVGLHTIYELLKAGHRVTVLNRGLTPATFAPEVEVLKADRRDREQMRRVLQGRRFDALYDIVCEQVEDAEIVADVLPGMGHYILCSGTRIYAVGEVAPVHEDSPLDPEAPADSIGAIRLICADILTEAGKRDGYPVTVLRPHRIYGPHNYNLDWEPSYFARIEKGSPIIVPGDGLNMHQWIHVDDLARSFIACMGNPRSYGEVYIVAGDEAWTVNGYIGLIGEIVGGEPNIVYLEPKRLADLSEPVFPYNHDFTRIFSIERIQKHLGWRPAFDMRRGLVDTYRWYREAGLAKHAWDFSYEEKVAGALSSGKWPP